MRKSLVVVGDALLDRDIDGAVDRVAPDAPVPVVDQSSERARPGGAGLAALLAARDGIDTTLVTALGRDDAGETIRSLLAEEGVEVIDAGTSSSTPEKIRIRSLCRPLVRLDRGGSGSGEIGPIPDPGYEAIDEAEAVLVSDYGRGMSSVKRLTLALSRVATRTPIVWDPHPRGANPVAGSQLVTPNLTETSFFAETTLGDGLREIQERARTLIGKWSVGGVVVTMGSRGAVFIDGSAHPLVVPAPRANAIDPCGAGDRFAVSAATGLARGFLPSETVTRAVLDSARFVATGGAGALVVPKPRLPESDRQESPAVQLAARVRDSGGTVIATGGCFDLIHPGHVSLLESARALGDCLIVCLNSDDSVRKLKGRDRPVNSCADRTAVLEGLSSVDAVEVFHSTTPHDALRRIKPHIWVKGGDYGSASLPEAPLIESWGGDVVILPYMRGHSTTGILDRARKK